MEVKGGKIVGTIIKMDGYRVIRVCLIVLLCTLILCLKHCDVFPT